MATVPTPFHYTANTVPTAANLNAGTEDALKWVMDPPRVSVYHSADRTLTTATWTLAIFDSENWDQDGPGSSGGMHSVLSNTSRLVAVTAGRYLVSALVYFAGNATGGRGVNFTKNGAGTRSSSNTVLSDAFAPGVANTNQLVPVTFEVALAANDYLEMFLYQSSGGNLNYIGSVNNTRVSMRWVSP